MQTTQDMAAPRRPLREPLHPDIDDALVEDLVRSFYRKVRAHPRLGPMFDDVIGDDWDRHLGKMTDFWSSITMMTGRYKGKPSAAHVKLKQVRPDDFEIWLSLFRETLNETIPPHLREIFMSRAENIAKSFQLAMFFSPVEKASRESEA